MPDFTHIHALEDHRIHRVTFPQQRFDGIAVRELFEFSNTIADPQPRLLVDTTGVTMVPSGAMGMLITIRKRFMSTGGQLHIALPDPNIRTSFELANMQRLLHLFASVDEAMAAFKA